MIFFKKSKKKQNTEKEVSSEKIEEAPINALPEYTIRTMPDDLAKLGLGELQKEAKIEIRKKTVKPPETLPAVEELILELEQGPIQKAPLPQTEELITPAPPSDEIYLWPELPKPIEEPPKPLAIPEPEKIAGPRPVSPMGKPISPEPKILKIEKPKKKIRIKISKKFIFGLIIILIAIAVGAFFYWQGQKPKPLPLPQPEYPEPEQSLIIIDETKILKLSPGQQLTDLIKEEIIKDQKTKTLKRLAILKNDTEFLSLADIVKGLNMTIAPYALSELENDYTLVVYAQNSKKHLGIITEIKNENNLKDQLRFWEKTMGDDLQGLFIIEKPGSPATTNFQDNTYKNIAIRFINFPKPELTIDYTVSNGLFVLTTSREAIYKIIDNFNQ
jgi:hypothetical protein